MAGLDGEPGQRRDEHSPNARIAGAIENLDRRRDQLRRLLGDEQFFKIGRMKKPAHSPNPPGHVGLAIKRDRAVVVAEAIDERLGRGGWLNLCNIRSGGSKRRGQLTEKHCGRRAGVSGPRGRCRSKPVDAGDDPRQLRGVRFAPHLRHKPRQRRCGAFGREALRRIEPRRDDLRRVTTQARKRRIAAPGISAIAFEERAEDRKARLGRKGPGDKR